jgi:hypothetical protein
MESLSLTVSEPVIVPVVAGAKARISVQLAPAASVAAVDAIELTCGHVDAFPSEKFAETLGL